MRSSLALAAGTSTDSQLPVRFSEDWRSPTWHSLTRSVAKLLSVLVSRESETVSFMPESNICKKLSRTEPSFCLCENKGADLLHGKCTADQCLCFR